MSELPTGTVTFLFTDIEGSTTMVKRLGPAYAEVLAEHQQIVRAAAAAHGGREVDTQGDSFFIAFGRAKDGVAAAVAIQRDLVAHSWPEGGTVKVRMGLHTGEPLVGEERYVGIGVNRAARIGAAGHGGQVLLSRATRELVEDELPPGVTIRDLGERRLKDIERLEHIWQLEIEGLPSKFGRLRTLDAELAGKRRRMYAGAALIGVLAAAVAVPVFALGQESGGPVTTVSPNSVGVIDPDTNELVAEVPVGIRPGPVAVGDGAVWVANLDDQTVSRIDPEAREVVRTIPVGGFPSDVAVGEGAIWVLLPEQLELARISPAFGEVEGRPLRGMGDITSCPTTSAIAVDGGRAWITCFQTAKIDLDSGRSELTPRETLASPAPFYEEDFADITAGLGSSWVVNRAINAVTRIDPDTNTGQGAASVTVGKSPYAITVGAGALWVAGREGDTVSRVDVRLGRPPEVTTIPVGDGPVDVAYGEDAVWVANSLDGTVSRIDTATNEVVATVQVHGRPQRVAAGEGAVWVTLEPPLATE